MIFGRSSASTTSSTPERADWSCPCGTAIITHPESATPPRSWSPPRERVRHALTDYDAAWVEQKPLGLTVHYRGVRRRPDRSAEADVAHAIEPLCRALRVLDGPMAIEITPDLGWTKARRCA